MVKVKPGAKVITIKSSVNALGLEEVVKLFFRVFEEVCALKEVDEFVVDGLTHGLTAAEVTAVFLG